MAMNRIAPALILSSMSFLTGSALAQAPASAATAAAPAELHRITGFRSARFGMDAAQVREAIARDFKAAAGDISEIDNPAEKTRVITLRLGSLDPAPGPAVVSYILGASTQKLIHVNVNWSTGAQPSDAERNQMAGAGVQLANYFKKLRWKPKGTAESVAEGPNAVLLFAGVDTSDAAVELHLAGVMLRAADGSSTPPTGPASLRVAYVADMKKRDIAPGAAASTPARAAP